MLANIIEHDHQTCVITLSGKLVFQARQTFQQTMNKAEQTSPRLIILDLTELSYIDSAGLGLLALTHQKLSPNGISLAIANAQSTVKNIILLSNLNRMYPLYDSVSAASPGCTATALSHS